MLQTHMFQCWGISQSDSILPMFGSISRSSTPIVSLIFWASWSRLRSCSNLHIRGLWLVWKIRVCGLKNEHIFKWHKEPYACFLHATKTMERYGNLCPRPSPRLIPPTCTIWASGSKAQTSGVAALRSRAQFRSRSWASPSACPRVLRLARLALLHPPPKLVSQSVLPHLALSNLYARAGFQCQFSSSMDGQ